jgi:hypothetical protein
MHQKSSPSAIPYSTQSSEPSAAKPRSPARVKPTSRKPPAFATAIAKVPQALHHSTPQPILLRELAVKLDVEPGRLLPLIEHKYLKLVCANPPTVNEPPPAALEWLRQMLLPITLRPFLSTEMIAMIEGITPHEVRNLCIEYDVPMRFDPVFGELLSLTAYYAFHSNLYRYRDPARFDRQAMIVALLHAANPHGAQRLVKPRTFSIRLEDEIRRIVALDEPARTDAASRLWTSYEDGLKLAGIVAEARGEKVTGFWQMRRVAKIVMAEFDPKPRLNMEN